ncbi:MAG: hypothetical protein ACREAY_04170 [Nitrososphaera sp.]|uniref:hypothetical protein n=1 Tax=Nitrososphaera sp. TaxID=1971748 RepID=UPI003D6F527D
MSIVKLVSGTRRHPANRALHAAGLPIYATGIAMVAGHFAGAGTDPLLGAALWSAAVVILVSGHAIEGNVMSMTPVLVTRLVHRSLSHYLAKHGIHLFGR